MEHAWGPRDPLENASRDPDITAVYITESFSVLGLKWAKVIIIQSEMALVPYKKRLSCVVDSHLQLKA